jgi:hypothetical protein
MQIIISLQTIAIITGIVTPLFLYGWNNFIFDLILRIVSLNSIEKIVEADIHFRKKLQHLKPKRYYLAMVGVPILEEYCFRLIPFLAIYYLQISSVKIIFCIGIISSLVFWATPLFEH